MTSLPAPHFRGRGNDLTVAAGLAVRAPGAPLNTWFGQRPLDGAHGAWVAMDGERRIASAAWCSYDSHMWDWGE